MNLKPQGARSENPFCPFWMVCGDWCKGVRRSWVRECGGTGTLSLRSALAYACSSGSSLAISVSSRRRCSLRKRFAKSEEKRMFSQAKDVVSVARDVTWLLHVAENFIDWRGSKSEIYFEDFKTSRTFLFLHFTFRIRASNVVKTWCLILQVVQVIQTHS